MSTIYVIHTATGEGPVAAVNYDGPSSIAELEFAYRWTQNIMDSWSMGGKHDGNPAVKRIAPLHIQDGEEWGLRSSMVGDRMIRNGEVWIVDRAGFKKAID